MTLFDKTRLTNETFKLDIEGIRRGDYSDQYFANVVTIMEALNREGYTFEGNSPREVPVNPAEVRVGDIEVEAQIFNRREPYALVAGVDAALAMIRHATGYYEDDQYVETWQDLEVVAVEDGAMTRYNGDPNDVQTVIEIRGRYRDFALLETPMLGVLTRASRVATNCYDVLNAAGGKPVLFFPARFDLPAVQAIDGYAYWLAVQRYNHESGQDVRPIVSTDAQGAWWGGAGGGTVPHAIVACFFADTAESMKAFARHMPLEMPRIALVDFNNDTVRDSIATMAAYWEEYWQALESGDEAEQQRWTLNGVRLDTASNMRDAALDEGAPTGVSPLLVRTVRQAMSNAWTSWGVPHHLEDAAKSFCQNVQIVVSGGFNKDKIERFEQEDAPVDSYGVGSKLFANGGEYNTDYTMDVVRLRVNGKWFPMAKIGRQPCDNDDLRPVDLAQL